MDHNEDMPLVAKKKDKGFTLVELLIVIVILGILATVTVFAVRGLTGTAKTNACDSERKAVLTSVEGYRALSGNTTIPTDADTNPVTTPLIGSTPALTLEANGFTGTSAMWTVNASGSVSFVPGNSNGCLGTNLTS